MLQRFALGIMAATSLVTSACTPAAMPLAPASPAASTAPLGKRAPALAAYADPPAVPPPSSEPAPAHHHHHP